MNLQFKLEGILEELEITKNHLAVETKTRPATVLSIAKGEIKRIDLEMITDLLDYLNKLASEKGIKKNYTIDSIFNYSYEENHQS